MKNIVKHLEYKKANPKQQNIQSIKLMSNIDFLLILRIRNQYNVNAFYAFKNKFSLFERISLIFQVSCKCNLLH